MTQEHYSLSRRSVLKTTATVGALSALGFPLFGSATAAAQTPATETIWLSHSTSVDGSNVTRLFTVDLDSSPGDALLTHVYDAGAPFQNVDAIAATPDGENIVLIDRNTKHVGVYDVDQDSFEDRGQVSGLPTITVLAAYGLDGVLYAASNTTNKLYSVDTTLGSPSATEIGLIVGAPVNGADIVFDSQGVLYLHSNSNDTLYTVDYQNVVNGEIAATVVGTDDGSSLTGLAIRDSGLGDLVGSSRADDAIVVLGKGDGQRTATFPMKFNGSSYAYTNGDMTVGFLADDTCIDCESDDLLAKYEFDATEFDEDGEPIAYDFVLETGDGDAVSYVDFVSKDGDMWEPVSATFDTEFCSVWAVVKAGQELSVQGLTADDGSVTANYVDPYAISFVAFFCTEEAAQAFAESFPSKGRGR